MIDLNAGETPLLLFASFTGLMIGLFVLIGKLDRWIKRFADWIVTRSERRKKSVTKPHLDG